MSISDKQNNTVKSVKNLIEVCKEGERGYKQASENVDHDEFKTILYRLSQQRALFASELENEIRKDFGEEYDSGDSVISKLHRGWMDFKLNLNSNDTKAILEECERGEKHAIEKYTETLDNNLPSYLHERVNGQLEMIKGTLNQIREFESEVSQA